MSYQDYHVCHLCKQFTLTFGYGMRPVVELCPECINYCQEEKKRFKQRLGIEPLEDIVLGSSAEQAMDSRQVDLWNQGLLE